MSKKNKIKKKILPNKSIENLEVFGSAYRRYN